MVNSVFRFFAFFEEPGKNQQNLVPDVGENQEDFEGVVAYLVPDFFSGIEGFFAYPADSSRKDAKAVPVVQKDA